MRIPLTTALFGGTVTIPTVDGDVELKVPSGIQPGEDRVLRNRGIPKLNRTEKGDHWVTFQVEIPKQLNEHQKKLIKEAF